ncbi:MAG TPA: Ig-like domain-containing protein, partial [Bryobacteraceae bacterium]|nr:Ig-like domain-containing protein [Bryobacteraceae bacterium]
DGYRSSLKIPNNISPGKHTLTVMAQKNVPGARPVFTMPVTIDIERFDRLLSLSITPETINMQVGDQSALTVDGVYADGSMINLSNSTQTSFVSESPNIATVTHDGLVTAIAAGSTRIRIRTKFLVPVTVKPRDSR